MKITMKKSLAVILSLVMCVSVLFGMNLSAFAADTNIVNYVYSGDYVYNWGERGTTATFLSPMAEDFYAENDIALSELLALSGSSTESGVPSSALFSELHELMESNHDYITSYDATKNLFQYTDCQNSGGKISSFYSGTGIGPSWNSNEWNREHVWPNSKGDAAGNGENDLMMLRPTSTSENSSRGNKAYGTTTTTQYYNPNDEGDGAYDLRGDCARIILYQYVRWECTNTGSKYNSNGIFGADGVIESKKVLLDWIEQDPVDTWELGRNDAAESILGTRNIFVDYPELAFDLLDVEIPKHQTPSGYANGNGTDDDVIVDEETGSEGNTGDSTGGSTVEAQATITFDADKSQRTSYSTSQQVWENDGLKLTNNKASSTTNVGDYSNPGRFYKSSEVIIEYPNMTSLVIDCTGLDAKYVVWENSLNDSNATAKTENQITTITFATPVDSVTFASMSAQARAVSITAYGATQSGGSGGDDSTEIPTNAFSAIANDDTFGTVVTNGNVVTVTPADGYKLSETEPYLVEGGEATVTDNGNGTYTISNVVGDATISFNFETTTTGDEGGTEGDTAYYEKVTSAPANGDWSGQYLIVYETDKVAFNGALNASTIDAGNNVTSTLTIVDGKITADETTNAACFFIEAISDGYSIKSAGGAYIGNDSSSNGMSEHATTTYVNTISDTGVIYGKGGCKLQFYKTVGSTGYRFRYYASSQQPVYLYKLVETGSSGGDTPETPTYTISYDVNDALMGSASLVDNVITATATDGYKLKDGDVAYTVTPADAATVVRNDNKFTVSATKDVTVTINFESLPTYTIRFSENGEETNTLIAYEGQPIVLPSDTATPSDKVFVGWATVQNATSDIKGAGTTHTVSGAVTFYAQYKEISDQPTTQATITFDDTSKRDTCTTEKQIWTENGIIVTNNKTSESSNVVEDFNPVRFYKNSELIIANPSKMTKIVVNANTTDYATALANSISDANAVVTTNDKVVTIVFIEAINEFTVTLSGGQVRVDSITVYTIESSGNDTPKYFVSFVENGEIISKQYVELGTEITLPIRSGITDEEIVGWLLTGENDPREPGSTYMVSGNATFTAQYKVTEGGDSGSGGETTTTVTYNFKDYSEGAAVKNYDKVLDDTVTFGLYSYTNTNSGWFNSSDSAVRIYANQSAVIKSTKFISSIVLNAGNKGGTFDVLTSTDGSSWSTAVANVSWTSTFSDVTIDLPAAAKFIKIDKPTAQIRVKTMTLSFVETASVSPIVAFKGAQVSVGSDLSLSYYVDLININPTDEVVMKVKLEGEDVATDIVWNPDNKIGTKYIFTFDDIPPQCMADTINAKLYVGDTELATLDYSIQQNAKNLLDAYPNDAKLKRFISDMLYYGEAAQLYRNYKTDSLATSGLSLDTQRADTPETLRGVLSGATTGTVSFKSATVWFDAVNCLVVKINNPANLEKVVAVINDEEVVLDYHEATGGYITDGIKATDFATEYVFKIYENDKVDAVQTLTYSVNAYASSKYDNSTGTMKDLALALYRYGVSAKEYSDSIA